MIDFRCDAPELLGKASTVTRNVLQHHFQDEAGDRIEVASTYIASDAKSLQRNRATARERVDHKRRLYAMCCFHERPAHVDVRLV
jgi:hypothetical protein